MLKNIFTSAFTLCIVTGAFAFEGDYSLTGYDPYDKMDYKGSLSIIKDRNVYQAKWTIKEGGREYKYVGTGFEIDEDIISFVFKETTGSDEGLQIYMRTDDQTLQGPYVMLNKNLVGTETVKLNPIFDNWYK